jgi:hypothetical protein
MSLECARRRRATGKKVRIVVPEQGSDMNDALQLGARWRVLEPGQAWPGLRSERTPEWQPIDSGPDGGSVLEVAGDARCG